MAVTIVSISEPRSSGGAALKPDWASFLSMGFRPCYLLGSAWAVLSVALWVFAPGWVQGAVPGVFWHIHEMLWGFVAMIAAGFLLTASANWTGMMPAAGWPLAGLCGLWLLARVGFLLPGLWPLQLGIACEVLFFVGVAVAVARVVLLRMSQRNYVFPFLFLGFAASDIWFVGAVVSGAGYAEIMSFFHVGLLVMALVVVLVAGRVLPFFASRALPEVEIPMCRPSGWVQLVLCVAALVMLALSCVWEEASEVLLPVLPILLLAIGGVTLYRWVRWKPWASRHKPILWILYAGYLAFGLGLLVFAAWQADMVLRTAWSAHLLGVGGMGLLIVGMMTRTSLGHLGRPLVADKSMVVSYWLVLAALLLRLLALSPPGGVGGTAWLYAAAVCWMAAFGLYCWRFFPWLIRPRL